MLGAIIGDIVGSRFEFHNIKSKQFDLFTKDSFATDDTIMTIAVAKSFVECKPDYSDLADTTIYNMSLLGNQYPDAGYGGMFNYWLQSVYPEPYNSFGNGAAMRVSPVGWAARSMDEVKDLSYAVTAVTHNHAEGIKGAEATAVAVYMAKNGYDKKTIKSFIDSNYYLMNFTLDGIRESYSFNETCQQTVPQALMAFFESVSFEDAIRNAISIGGDSDTIAAITGGVAEAYYKAIPRRFKAEAYKRLDKSLSAILMQFCESYDVWKWLKKY